jgi:hypothetical protein
MNAKQEDLLKAVQSQRKKIDEAFSDIKAAITEQSVWRESDEDSDCLKNLYASASGYESHKDLNPDRVSGTCEWFLNHDQYHTWQQENVCSILWVSAGPGCGISVLSRYLVDDFNRTYSRKSHTICYFFFKDISEERRSVASAFCAILHQLFLNRTSLLKHAMVEYANKGPPLMKDFGILWKIFTAAVTDPHCGEVICVVDALDESEESARVMLINKLTDLHSSPGSQDIARMKLKFIVTSRPYLEIEQKFRKLTRELPTCCSPGWR